MIDLYNTFAPVVNWSTVRLIIVMSEISGWESIQIIYALAFSQAPIDIDVYLHLLENWFDMFKTELEYEGFKQNKVDRCLFVRNNFIVIFYVDDCCIFSKYK